MDAELAASIRAELDERAAQATADYRRRQAVKLQAREMFTRRRDAGLKARHQSKLARQRDVAA